MGPHFWLLCACPGLAKPVILYLSSGPPDMSVTQLFLFWFFWPTWSGIQFNIFRTVVPITTKQELLSVKCSTSTHAHMHTHICACAHTRAQPPHIFKCMHTHIHPHEHSLIDIHNMQCTPTCMHMHTLTCARTHIIHVHMHRYIPACIHICTKAHAYIHKHVLYYFCIFIRNIE